MINDVSLFGEETAEQVFNLLKDIEDLKDGFGICRFPEEEKRLTNSIFNIRESILIDATNKIVRFFEETESLEFTSETWTELKTLYLYGQGYHRQTKAEIEKRQRAYKLFRFQLAKNGKLTENIDLCRDATF